MNRRLQMKFVLSAGLLILTSRMPVQASELSHSILVRNALNQSVQLESINNQSIQALEKSTIRPRWEKSVANVIVGNISSTLMLGIKIWPEDKSQTNSEIIRCETHAMSLSATPQIVVIVHNQKGGNPQCDVVDLNVSLPAAKAL